MKRLMIVGGVIASVWFGYFFLATAFRSDEDQVRLVVESIVRSLNDGDGDGVLDPLAMDWREESAGLDRPRLATFLRAARLRGRSLESFGGKRLRAEILGDISVTVDGDRATAIFGAAATRRDGGTRRQVWEADYTCTFERISGDWLMTRAQHETVSGRRPF